MKTIIISNWINLWELVIVMKSEWVVLMSHA